MNGRTARRPLLVACFFLVAVVCAGLVLPVRLPEVRTLAVWAAAVGTVSVVALLLARSEREATRRVLVVVLVAVPVLELALGAYQPQPAEPRPTSDVRGRLAPFLRAAGGRSIISGSEELGNQAFLRTALRPNINATERVRSLDGYDGGPWLTRRWTEAMEAFTKAPFVVDLTLKSQLNQAVPTDLAARFGVQTFVVDRRTTDPAAMIPGWQGPVLVDGPLQVFENPDFQSEALVYRRTEPADDRPLYEQLATLEDPYATALTEGAPRRSCDGSCDPVPVRLVRRRPERLHVDLRGTSSGMLVVAEGWDPGWTVRVDGERRDLVIADRNFLAVRVEEGDREVRLAYRTPGLRLGISVSAIVSLGLLGLLGMPRLMAPLRRRWRSGE